MSIPHTFHTLVDDAAIFPPGLAPLPQAVTEHTEHLGAAHRDLVGPLVVATSHLAELTSITDDAALDVTVSVVVPIPALVADTVATVEAAAHLDLAGLEVKLEADRPLTAQIREIAGTDRGGVPVYVEVPRPGHPEWSAILETTRDTGLRLKFRTGGTEAEAFPDEVEVATWIRDAVGAGLVFKCTAGLHHAVRHTGADTGFEHHGYLNILLATARALEGADVEQIAEVLAERSPEALAAAVAAHPDLATARTRFASYGSCSILEPLHDLEALGLLPARKALT